MKLIIQNSVVVGTASDDYEAGPFDESAIAAPSWFDPINDLQRYVWTEQGGLQRAATKSVSPRQIRQALTRAGLRASVEAAVAAGDQDLKDWWEFATAFERSNQHVINMGVALGVTERQLDDLWALAETL